MEAAGHDHQDFRLPRQNILPGYSDGIRPLVAEVIHSTGDADHLGNPVTAAVDRIKPLHAEDTRPRRGCTGSRSDAIQNYTAASDELVRLFHAAGGRAYFAQVIFDLSERLR